MADRGYVVLVGSIDGRFPRGSIIPVGAFPEDRIRHWVARGSLRRANEDDVASAEATDPLGSQLDPLSPTEAAAQTRSGREAEIAALEARLVELKKRNEDLSAAEETLAAQHQAEIDEARAAEEEPQASSRSRSTRIGQG